MTRLFPLAISSLLIITLSSCSTPHDTPQTLSLDTRLANLQYIEAAKVLGADLVDTGGTTNTRDKMSRAADYYVKSYLEELGKDDIAKTESADKAFALADNDKNALVASLISKGKFLAGDRSNGELRNAYCRAAVGLARANFEAGNPEDSTLLLRLAEALTSLADCYSDTDKPRIAAQAYEEAIAKATLARDLGSADIKARATVLLEQAQKANKDRLFVP